MYQCSIPIFTINKAILFNFCFQPIYVVPLSIPSLLKAFSAIIKGAQEKLECWISYLWSPCLYICITTHIIHFWFKRLSASLISVVKSWWFNNHNILCFFSVKFTLLPCFWCVSFTQLLQILVVTVKWWKWVFNGKTMSFDQ